MPPTLEETQRLMRPALRALNPFAVEYRYDDELVSSLSRDEINAVMTAVLIWAGRQVNA